MVPLESTIFLTDEGASRLSEGLAPTALKVVIGLGQRRLSASTRDMEDVDRGWPASGAVKWPCLKLPQTAICRPLSEFEASTSGTTTSRPQMSTFAYAHDPMTDDLSSELDSVQSSNHYHADPDEDLHPRHPHTAFSRSEAKPLRAVPDLRFEQSYMRSIKPYIHLEPRPEGHSAHAVKLDVMPVVDSERQIARLEWGQLIWVTTRDQVISPFLQGALW